MKKYYLQLIGLVSIGILAIALPRVFAWTEPTAAPPNDNVPAPINVSTDLQSKAGNLGLGGRTATASTGLNVYGSTYGVYGEGGNRGIHGQGGSTGVFGVGTTSGLQASGGAYGVFSQGNSYGLWSQGGSYGVYSIGSSYGVYGRTSSGSGSGVYGENTGAGYGVTGEAISGRGVRGISSSNYGVYGESGSSSGVYGTGNYGVYGTSSAAAGAGVYGYSSHSSGSGIRGYNGSTGAAVYGETSSGTGVSGTSINGKGVQGSSTTSNGVYGASTGNHGVYGFASGVGNAGVYANSSSYFGVMANGIAGGVYATNSGTTDKAFLAVPSWGVQGESDTGGVRGQNPGSSIYGILGYSAGSGYAVYGWTSVPTTWSGYFLGGKGVYVQNNLGVGTNTPTHKLEVAGGDIYVNGGNIEVRSGSFIDDGSTLTVPDYVFEPEYDLRTIAELKSYIEKEKHLPNVPSEEEIKENGVDITALQMNLLEKIEELTLYTIQQQEEIDKLKEEVERLKD